MPSIYARPSAQVVRQVWHAARQRHTSSNQEFLDFLKFKEKEEQEEKLKKKEQSPFFPVANPQIPKAAVTPTNLGVPIVSTPETTSISTYTLSDGYDATSCSSDAAKLFDESLDTYMRLRGPLVKSLRKCLGADNQFILGLSFMGCLNVLGGATLSSSKPLQDYVQSVKESLDTRSNSKREEFHATAFLAYAHGNVAEAACTYDRILDMYPTDLLALRMSHDIHFLTGDRGRLWKSVETSLLHWDKSDPRLGFIYGMHAFGLEECGRYDEAENSARKALEMCPNDAWAVHALAHVYEMTKRPAEGLEFLHETEENWKECNLFSPHIYWHGNLFRFQQARVFDMSTTNTPNVAMDESCARDIISSYIKHTRKVDPETWVQMTRTHEKAVPEVISKRILSPLDLTDATSTLVRLQLAGVEVQRDMWDDLKNQWGRKSTGGNYWLFNDAHVMLLHVFSGNLDEAEELFRRVRDESSANSCKQNKFSCVDVPWIEGPGMNSRYDHFSAVEGSTQYNHEVAYDIGLPLFEGLLEYGRGNYDCAARLLDISFKGGAKDMKRMQKELDRVNEKVDPGKTQEWPEAKDMPFAYVGGSHAQRDVFRLVWKNACRLSMGDHRGF